MRPPVNATLTGPKTSLAVIVGLSLAVIFLVFRRNAGGAPYSTTSSTGSIKNGGAGGFFQARVAEQVRLEFEGRPWWMKELGLRKLPWEWEWGTEGEALLSDDRALAEIMYPCEATCEEVHCNSAERKMRSKCRLQCPDPFTCLTGLNRTTCKDARRHSEGLSEDCVREMERFCNQEPQKIPFINFGREPFSLADVAVQLFKNRRESRNNDTQETHSDPRPENNVRVLFIGDSVAHEYLQLARCHLMRTVNLQTAESTRFLEGPGKMFWLPAGMTMGTEKRNHLEFAVSSDFHIPSSLGVINLTLSLHLANRAIAQDVELLLDNCLRHDLVVFDWALHYFDPFADGGIYEQEMTAVMEAFKRCMELRYNNGGDVVTVVYANHPMQHFFKVHPKGWYKPGKTQKGCTGPPPGRLGIDRDALDGWTEVLRNVAEQSSSSTDQLVITPVPWGSEKRATCPAGINRDQLKRVFWVPYMDLTEPFTELHKQKSGDCSHLRSIPQFGTPLWDALFWSVVQQTNEWKQRCLSNEETPKPEFSSLLKYRNGKRQRTVDLGFREHFELSQVTNPALMPLIALRSNETKHEWRARYNAWKSETVSRAFSAEEEAKQELRKKKLEN